MIENIFYLFRNKQGRDDGQINFGFIIIFFQKIKFLLLRLQKKEQHDKCK